MIQLIILQYCLEVWLLPDLVPTVGQESMFLGLLPASEGSELLPLASHLCLSLSVRLEPTSRSARAEGVQRGLIPPQQGSCGRKQSLGRGEWKQESLPISQTALFTHSFVESLLYIPGNVARAGSSAMNTLWPLSWSFCSRLVVFTRKTLLTLLPCLTPLGVGVAFVCSFMLHSLQLDLVASIFLLFLVSQRKIDHLLGQLIKICLRKPLLLGLCQA